MNLWPFSISTPDEKRIRPSASLKTALRLRILLPSTRAETVSYRATSCPSSHWLSSRRALSSKSNTSWSLSGSSPLISSPLTAACHCTRISWAVHLSNRDAVTRLRPRIVPEGRTTSTIRGMTTRSCSLFHTRLSLRATRLSPARMTTEPPIARRSVRCSSTIVSAVNRVTTVPAESRNEISAPRSARVMRSSAKS